MKIQKFNYYFEFLVEEYLNQITIHKNHFAFDSLEMKVKEATEMLSKVKRHLLPYAENIAEEVIEWMKEGGNIEKIDVLGSLRRKSATVGDIDILVVPKNSKTQKIQNSKER